ncbi:uromodulin-like [Pseudophryne corroboree]|uniref:uromodulin-like n=1 Tax=Pseudophryne corroboree TaxID=495146 RepID=UPI003081D9AB
MHHSAGINGTPPFCSTCSGTCTANSGCTCATTLASCLPDSQTCLLNSTACCLSGLSWYPPLACCIEEPYCTPACLSDEVCQYANSTAVCAANTTFYQTLDLSVQNLSAIVTCKGSNMTVSVNKNLLEALHYNPAASTLSQYTCTGAVVSTLEGQRVYSLTVQSSYGTCGNTMTKNATHVKYTNTLNIPGNISNGIITVSNISAQFSCTYNITMETSLYTVFNPVLSTQNLNTGSTAGEAATTLAAYVSPTYTDPLVESQMQNVAVGSTLYFGMSTTFADPAFVLRVEQCFSTPTSDGSGSVKIQLLQGGCSSTSGPSIQVVENGDSKEVRFSVTTFAFRGFSNVYIFCDARLCNTASEKCSSCSSSRDISEGTAQFTLGPFIFTALDYTDNSAISHGGLSFTLLLGSLLSLWILLLSEIV